jgi:hypothetical protein
VNDVMANDRIMEAHYKLLIEWRLKQVVNWPTGGNWPFGRPGTLNTSRTRRVRSTPTWGVLDATSLGHFGTNFMDWNDQGPKCPRTKVTIHHLIMRLNYNPPASVQHNL